MNTLETQMTKLPPYIKEWYKSEAKGLGQKTTPYVSRILIEIAIANGAKEEKKVQSNNLIYEVKEHKQSNVTDVMSVFNGLE